MSEIDWSELGVSGLLPTGTVTLLLADVEGSTRLWETQPEEMTAALARHLGSVIVQPIMLSCVDAAHAQLAPVHQRRIHTSINLAHASQHAVPTNRKTSAQTRRLRPAAAQSTTPLAEIYELRRMV